MKFDKHYIHCNIFCDDGMIGAATDCSGNVDSLWRRMQAMAAKVKGRKIDEWMFWVTLRRGAIEVQAEGKNLDHATVLIRAERILLAAESAYEKEHAA